MTKERNIDMYIAFDFQIENTHDAFVVCAFVCDTPSTHKQWKPLRNFGDRQSGFEDNQGIEYYALVRDTTI